MLKRISAVAFLSLGAMYYAQDASVIKNTAEIYSSSDFGGTAKFNSMAGSMGALGGDLSAITINPAGTGVFIWEMFPLHCLFKIIKTILTFLVVVLNLLIPIPI